MKIISGKVVSAKMNKTIVVEVKRQRIDPLYKKIIRRSRNYKVHYENETVKENDFVQIAGTRPISKEVHYKLVRVLKKS